MKPVIRNLLIVLSLILLGKLFIIPPKNLYFPSKSIRKSKWENAYVGECRIFKIDTFMVGYEFPVEKIWVEKYYSLGRNLFGIVITVTEDKKRIIVDIIPDHPFFRKGNCSDEWVIKDSLAHRIGTSYNVINLDCPYQQGDIAIFNIFKMTKGHSNLWRDETMEPIFKIYTVCDWEGERLKCNRLFEKNKESIVDQTENANKQYNKSSTWDNIRNTLGMWLTMNPNMIFNLLPKNIIL